MRRTRQGGLAVALAFAALAASASEGFAHASFLASQPAAGGRVETSPRQVTLDFSEPLVTRLTRAELTETATGDRVRAEVAVVGDDRVVIRPRIALVTGAYRIDWHTVSPDDGHALEGSVGFGVRADAAGAGSVEQSPLERGGWLRLALRAVFYLGLIFFAGGVFTALALRPREGLGGWLIAGTAAGPDAKRRLASRTVDSGWVAIAAGTASVVVDALDAGGTFELRSFDEYLLSNAAGTARLVTLGAILAAALLATRHVRLGATAVGVGLAGVAVAGHANSADARTVALIVDWIHLVAGSVWIGGIAHLAVTWWRPPVDRSERTAVIHAVLPRFGSLALPAFFLVVASGLINAAIQLDGPAALWRTGYGQILAIKVALVAAVALVSAIHALRIRPRLLDGRASAGAERRHWRLLRVEPLAGAAVIAVAAGLVAFPLPPRQLAAVVDASASQAAACDPCPQRAAATDELAVAEQAGTRIVAAWTRATAAGTVGEVRVLERKSRPSRAPVRLVGVRQSECGVGCHRFRTAAALTVLRVDVGEGDRTYRALLPVGWQPGANRRAARLLRTAERAMRGLRTFRQVESVTSGPGTFARTTYRLKAPDRLSLVTDREIRTVTVGDRDWLRTPGSPWELAPSRRPAPFRTRGWFRWTPFSESARLLTQPAVGGRRLAQIAVYDRATPAWYRLTVDIARRRVLRARMVADAHFMWQRFDEFNRLMKISAPT